MASGSRSRPELRPRKQPRQARAQVTRDMILLGAERVLQTRGADALTTNRVAEAAGVSVGSVYQYFPNKRAVVAALIEMFLTRAFNLFAATLEAMRDTPLEAIGETIARGMLDLYHLHAATQAPLYKQISALDLDRVYQRQIVQYVEQVRRFIVARRDLDLRGVNVDAVAYVLVSGVEGVMRALATETMPCDVEAVAGELTRMAVRYLRGMS